MIWLLESSNCTIVFLFLFILSIPSVLKDDWRPRDRGLLYGITSHIPLKAPVWSYLFHHIIFWGYNFTKLLCKLYTYMLKICILPRGNIWYHSRAGLSNVSRNALHFCACVSPCTPVMSLKCSICTKGSFFPENLRSGKWKSIGMMVLIISTKSRDLLSSIILQLGPLARSCISLMISTNLRTYPSNSTTQPAFQAAICLRSFLASCKCCLSSLSLRLTPVLLAVFCSLCNWPLAHNSCWSRGILSLDSGTSQFSSRLP